MKNLCSSLILSRRPKDDDARDGFTNWPFMTTHMWGENPRGKWRLVVRFQVSEQKFDCIAGVKPPLWLTPEIIERGFEPRHPPRST